jgi:ketosteroid isomerase-like protein
VYEKVDVEALERQFNSAMEEAETGTALEAIRRLYNELNRDDTEAVAAFAHAELRVEIKALFLEGKTYKGVRGFMNWRRDMGDLFSKHAFQPVGVRFAARDRWVVLGRLHVTEAETGSELDVPLAHAVEQRDRKVARITVYSDIVEALEASGLYA